MSGTERRVLLLLPTKTYRTVDFMSAAEKLGASVTVASEEPSTMEPLASGGLITLSFRDPTGAADAVAAFHDSFPLAAAIAVDEPTAVVAAAISERLGLPHNPRDAAERTRLKHRMRAALAEASVPSPAFRLSSVDEDSARARGSLRYPVVLKPVFLSGSRGVQRVDDDEGFLRAFAWLREFLARPDVAAQGGEDARRILIEEFVPGREVALEGLLTEGRLEMLALFDKPDPLDGPFFEETIYVTPSRLPEDVQARCRDVTARAAGAMGLTHGAVHSELRVSDDGAVSVIEVAGRSIGGLCSRTLRFGLGMSLEELLLRHALGEEVSSVPREGTAAGVMMLPVPGRGVLRAVRGLEQARAVPGVEDVVITTHVGAELVPLPEDSTYPGFIFARGESPARVEQALRQAHECLELELEDVRADG